MTEQLSNTVDLLSLGQDAIRALQSGSKAMSKANALFTYVIAQAWHTKLFECAVMRKGQENELDSFDLSDIAEGKGLMQANGSKDIKLSKARLDAVALNLFGIEQFNQSQTNTFKSCLDVVKNLFDCGVDPDQINLSERTSNLIVPYYIMNRCPDQDDENAYRHYKSLEHTDYVIDGKQGNSFAELKRSVTPKTSKQPTNKVSDKGASFKAAVMLATKTIKGLLDETVDSEMPAPNNELHQELGLLYLQLTKYFDHEPLKAKETSNKKVA